ncbi:MAG TPA: hypothetical protein VLQ46_01720 [Casimicrobiaceae bacterium]|nr:hypothetical protein [Casimicrobiaceae bacterium]
MSGAVDFSAGGFRFLPSVFQFSAGVAALPGHAIERVQFRGPVPLKQGFERIERMITQAGRPLTSFCACELRSPAPFTEQGFRAFNEVYVVTLQKWGLFDGKVNPVARSNVCPEIGPPPEPSFHAFSFTVAAEGAPSFVIAGSAEAREGGASYRERTVRHGETAPEAMREKARYVLGELERRLAAFGVGWADATATQVYTVHDLHGFLADEIVRRGAARTGLTWHYARPPVQGLEYEMDCRSVGRENVV